MPNTAIVILNYNGAHWLRRFLPAIILYSPECEVIVADNGSTDHSLQVLCAEFPAVRVIKLPMNYGFCGGYNRALAQIDAEYYLILNSDIEVTEGWTDPLIQFLEKNPHVAAIQPKIKSYHVREMFEHAGAAGGMLDTLGYPFCRGRLLLSLEKDEGQYDDEAPVFWATGACFLIRSTLFHDMGGFDEDFFAHMEEIDLCWRLQNHGYQVYYTSKSEVYHVGGGTLNAANPRKTYLNFRNGLALMIKNMSVAALIVKLPIRLILDGLAAIIFLVQGNYKHTIAVFRAHMHFYASLRKHWKKRKYAGEKGCSLKGMYPGSILYRYFVTGVRKTSSLTY
ncbi:MAG TPA: dTDP-Rha--alpha-D-GlcNAc-pyrophosphate polyprenol alpha-3-L-rhamnosyltransferase [Cytophagales bacterium]|jgi:GT2 family glycosyltransferase|nr:dTDP-Rha--alpha-D-GlcNAc-pyrophosphate polyprenol alpha-3-L-rhamnosyltransferase [Cytophagales bacterium]